MCFNEMGRCITEGHSSYVIANRETTLQSCYNTEESLSKILYSHQVSYCFSERLTCTRHAAEAFELLYFFILETSI